MMQLPKSDLEALLMLSCDAVDADGELSDRVSTSALPNADYNAPQTLLQSPSGQTTDLNSPSLEKPVLAEDSSGSEDKEDTRPMFRSEEDAFEVIPDTSTQSLESQRPGFVTDTAAHHTNGFGSSGLEHSNNGLEQERGLLPVLKNQNFLILWSGQVFSQLADKVYLVLMIALIANRFQSVDQTISGWVSSIMIAFTIPAVLFGSIAGVYVDRWPKKAILVTTNLLRGGLVFSLPFLFWITKGWGPVAGLPIGFCILLGVTFLVSTLTQFFAPAEQSAIPLVVERRHLLSANSLYTTTMMASVIIGFAVGEPLLALADTVAANLGWTAVGLGKELVVGSGYAIAGVILLLLKISEKNRFSSINGVTREGEIEQPHVFADIRDGIRYLGQQHRVRSAMIQLVLLFSVFAALAVLSVRLAEVIPEIKASQFGFLLAAGGVGMAIGATFVGQFGQRFPHYRLSLYGSLGMAAALFGLSLFSAHLWPTLLLITGLGGFAAIVGVPMQTTIQEETPEEMRGKVFGLQNNAINIALSLPLALAGVAETFFGIRAVFLGLAALMVSGGILTWYMARQNKQG